MEDRKIPLPSRFSTESGYSYAVSIYIDSSVCDCGTRIGSQILFSLFFSLTHTHIHTAHWSMQGETPQLWLQDGFSHHLATLLWNYNVGMWQEVRWWGNAAQWRRWWISEWEVIILPHLSYLLVLRVLWPEVAAHCLKLDVEMRQPVEQIHPPRRRIIHHGRHPDAAACRLSLHSIARFLTGKL